MLRWRHRKQLHRKANVHQAHRRQQIQQSGLQLLPSPLTRLMQIDIDAIPFQPLRQLRSLQSFQFSSESPLTKTFAQKIATFDQPRKIETLSTLQPLQLNKTQLDLIEMVWIALQSKSVLIQRAQQPFDHRLEVHSLVSQGFQ